MRHRLPMPETTAAPLPALGEDDDESPGLLVEAALAQAKDDPGRDIPPGLRVELEATLGADLSGVRVHDGERSAEAADALGARAFTVGQDIHVDRAAGAIDTKEGKRLLAHEAAHTVQQRGAALPASGIEIAADGSHEERAADRTADAFDRGQVAAVATTGKPQLAMDRHRGKAKSGGAGKPSKGDRDLLGVADDDYFLEAFVKYTAFRGGMKGLAKVDQGNPELDDLAETVRGAVVIFLSEGMPDREQRALDVWGQARTGVRKVIERARKRGGHPHLAAALHGMQVMDAYLGDEAADLAIHRRADEMDVASPDAGFMHEQQKAVDKAAREAWALVKKAQGALAGEMGKDKISAASATFELWYTLLVDAPDLTERVKLARSKGLLGKGQAAADVLKLTLSATKKTVSAVNQLASVIWPAAKSEAKDVFARFAKMAAKDDAKLVGDVIGEAIAVIDIVTGTLGLIDGILSGDGRAALKAAEKIASGGVSLGMMALGASAGASAMASGLVTMWFGIVSACADLGASLRAMDRNHELKVVNDFVTLAARIGYEGNQLAAACQELLAPSKHTNDPNMQAQVEGRIEERADVLAKEMAKKMAQLDGEVTATDDESMGHYPQVVSALGPEARNALSTITDYADNPLMVADRCMTVFRGINRMGTYAIAKLGEQRDSQESIARTAEIDTEIAEENEARGL